ncbi:hypothetical protein GY45DRAFT_1214943, partial [Cubamyces sp. BRFM 1775]
MACINTCRILRDWFERHPDNHLFLHYCPGHAGVTENEAVDADVKSAALVPDDAPGPTPTFHSYVKSAITEDALAAWRKRADAEGPRYWGRHTLKHPAFRSLRHTGNFPLKRLGNRPQFVARFVRCVTNHAPTGAYRLRFRGRLQEPYLCTLHDGPAAVHSREHV